MQPTIIKEVSKDDSDVSPDDIIVDPKTHHTYRKGRLIGKGGFAKVFEVSRICTGEPMMVVGASDNSETLLADKIIDKEVFSRRSTSKDKVKREISLHKDLIHPNIVRFFNFFSDVDGNVHILLEYCSQKSLLHVMKNRKVLTEPEVRYYMLQICEGVRYLHRRTILHRDLKLGNMFLTWDMMVKIGDFGLATQHQTSLSSASTLCGTPNYIAPEVLKKQGHSYEADIWALGCMMFAMLVGTPPFETKSLSRTYAKIAANEYEIPERLSPSAKSCITNLLSSNPKLRGHLHDATNPADLLNQPFFLNGFTPKLLPQSSATQPPILPLTVIKENHLIPSSTSNLNMDLTDGSSSPSSKIKTSLRQKFSQIFHTSNSNASSSSSGSSTSNISGGLLISQAVATSTALPSNNPDLLSCIPQLQSSSSAARMLQQAYRPPPDQLINHIIEALEQWVSRRPCIANAETELILSPISVVPLFVSKWIDYSNKYGFGYQLSDKTIGVLFNEGTRICQSAATTTSTPPPNTTTTQQQTQYYDINSLNQHLQCYEYTDLQRKSVAWTANSPPPSFVDLSSKLKLLDYFSRYMDEHLAEGVVSSLCSNQMRVSTKHQSMIPQVVRWRRNPNAVIMELNNGSVQINFIRDHAKVIFWGLDDSSLLLTYMATDKAPITYNLRTLPRLMTSSPTSPLLIIDQYISQSLIVLREIVDNLQSSRR